MRALALAAAKSMHGDMNEFFRPGNVRDGIWKEEVSGGWVCG